MASKGRTIGLLAFGVIGLLVGAEVFKISTANTVSVEVASQNIPVGTQITSSMVSSKLVHKDGLQPGYVLAKNQNELIGQFATEPITNGQQMTTYVVSGSGHSGVEESVPSGDVAVTVPVGITTGQGGTLSSGDKVDLLVSVPMSKKSANGGTEYATGYLATNVPVLGIIHDTSNENQVKGIQIAVSPTVASEVQGLLARNNGQNEGAIRFVVPGYNNTSETVSGTSTLASTMNGFQ